MQFSSIIFYNFNNFNCQLLIHHPSCPTVMPEQIYYPRSHSLTISSTINEKGSAIKRKITSQHLPKYHKKLKLSNKKVLQPSEDRLSELTTKQIDRLIQMQKIKSLLNDNKKGIQPTHINFIHTENHHPNVYQPNFIAKINRIAIERNIKHLKSEEFDESTLSIKEFRKRGLELQKKNLRFVKQYKADRKKKAQITYQQSQQKSISSIEDNYEQFQQTLEHKRKRSAKSLSNISKSRNKDTNIFEMNRWFNGMSTFYLDLSCPNKNKGSASMKIQDDRPQFDRNFDFEYLSSYNNTRYNSHNQTKSRFNHSRVSTVG